ncbi:MAG: hypothetical protein GX481_09160, partial [Atopobium sp.]|nr:hypothetical protein [Atopobium sp.]
MNISGGTVTANGNSGAGIGGGDSGAGGTVNISGGTVIAKSDYAAGIGGGDGGAGGTTTITGGAVNAVSTFVAGIGHGRNATDNGTGKIVPKAWHVANAWMNYSRILTENFTSEKSISSYDGKIMKIEITELEHIPVTEINGVASEMTVSTPLTLSGTVVPEGATNKTITWSISDAGTTEATLSGSSLSALHAGTVKVLATIVNGSAWGTNYTQEFEIEVTYPRLAVPTSLAWNYLNTTWDAVENSTGYSVQLYKDGIAPGNPKSVTVNACDFTSEITETGIYTFKVTAIGDGTAYSDSLQSGESTALNYTKPVVKYTINASANDAVYGNVTGAGDYIADASVTVTATANTGYHFVKWTENDTEVSTALSYIFTSSKNRTLVAVFEADVLPVFSIQPADQTVTAGTTASFSVTATGKPAPTYQWQVSTDGGANWNNIADATAASYSIASCDLSMDGYKYRCAAINTAGTAYSDPATLTVNAAPVISTHPASQTVTAGSTASFDVTATGNPALSYQWQVSIDNGSNWS